MMLLGMAPVVFHYREGPTAAQEAAIMPSSQSTPIEDKTCLQCGSIFTRKRRSNGKLVPLKTFLAMKFCGPECYYLSKFKLTEEQTSEAVALYDSGLSTDALAKRFGLLQTTMYHILLRETNLRTYMQFRAGEESSLYRGGSISDSSAHRILAWAVKKGIVQKGLECEACGCIPEPASDGRSELHGHHDDYNFPLKVRWLCHKCHHEWHRHNRATPRNT